MRSYWALILIDLKLALRNRSVLFFNYLFPVIFFLVFAQFMGAALGGGIPFVVGMVFILGILGNGLFGAGLRAAQEREADILRRFKVTPISPTPILVASMVTGWIVFIPTIAIVMGMAHFYYGMPLPERWLSLFAMISLGVIAFRAIGLIVASVANSVQESNILVQLLYMPMLFLSGATFPVSSLPGWARVVAQFLPASYLVTGFQGVFYRKETLAANASSVAALIATTILATFVSTQLFRWEKDEKIRSSAKLWVLGVLLPFFVLGSYQLWSRDHLRKADALWRDLRRRETLLIRDARVFVGDGRVFEASAVLIEDGRIARVFVSKRPDPADWNAELIEAAGKTLLPGLIDLHVFLGATGGAPGAPVADEDPNQATARALAAYLYCGITAVRSIGDPMEKAVELRRRVASGETLGTEVFAAGPTFITGGESSDAARRSAGILQMMAQRQSLSMPSSVDAARAQVRDLAARGVDAVAAALGPGADLGILQGLGDEAALRHLPLIVRTSSARETRDALAAGAATIELGSDSDLVPQEVFVSMAGGETVYVPTLSRLEAELSLRTGNESLLERSLLQQVGPVPLIQRTRQELRSTPPPAPEDVAQLETRMALVRANLLRALGAGVLLAAGSQAGSPLVLHGPTVQRELALWVEAGVPPATALQAATHHAAKSLGAANRLGLIEEGFDANLLLVNGNPLADITDLDRISLVIYHGERLPRSRLLRSEP